jgi:hypothetical protein
MSAQTPRHEITMKKLVLDLAGTESVTVRRDVEYGMTDSGPLVMDLYYPPAAASGSRLPAVVIVGGYPDVGVPTVLGCTFRQMEFCTGWARLIAQHGMVAIVGDQPASGDRCADDDPPRSTACRLARNRRADDWSVCRIRRRAERAVAPDERCGKGLEVRRSLECLHAGPGWLDRRRPGGCPLSLREPGCKENDRRSAAERSDVSRASGAG